MRGGGGKCGNDPGLVNGVRSQVGKRGGRGRGYPIPVNSLLCANAVVFFYEWIQEVG